MCGFKVYIENTEVPFKSKNFSEKERGEGV